MESIEKVNNQDLQAVDQPLTSNAAATETAGVEETVITPADAETVAVTETETDAPAQAPLKISDIIDRLNTLNQGDGSAITTDELSRIKQQFYNLVNELMAEQRDAHIAAGNAPETFNPIPVAEETEFKELMNRAKDLKNQYRARIEAQQLANLERKRAIIEQLNTMADDTDNVNRHYPQAKELQNEFKAIGEVPQQQMTQTWKAFQDAVEHFYDQWKVNRELRDYDFKKNLAEKQLLVQQARELAGENDPVTAFRRLQELHDKWRLTGPVAKDLREEIWQQFKDASAEINKRYQTFFEERKQREMENEQAKEQLCEQIEAIDLTALKSFSAWNEATQTIMDAQKAWKTLGYASRRANNLLFNRFRACCDAFFAAKAQFFRDKKEDLAANLALKTQLCEQAEALQDSTDWRKTSDILVELQQRWKSIGGVPKKQSDAIWKRFMTACNTFFDRKKHATSDTRRTEQANLKAKRAIIEELTALNSPEADVDRKQAIERINKLREQWQQTGHVPFREKDRLHDTYRETVRQLFDKYDIHERRARLDNFQESIDNIASDRTRLLRERDRLMRTFEARRSELATYENNLSFLSARSRSGASMLGDIERNIQRLKNTIAELESKVKLIDEKLA